MEQQGGVAKIQHPACFATKPTDRMRPASQAVLFEGFSREDHILILGETA